MTVLFRYCFQALWPLFFLATGCTVIILNLLFLSLDFFTNLFDYQAGIVNSFLLLFYSQPSLLVLAIPIGFLTALLIVYGRLSADREILAVESCGFSVWIFVWPMVGVSILVSLFLVAFMDILLPWGNSSYLKLQYKVRTESPGAMVRERVFIQDFKGYVLYVEQKDDRNNVLNNVMVLIFDENDYPYRTVLAKQGVLHQDSSNYHVILDLQNGSMQQLGTKKAKGMKEFYSMQFKSCGLDLSANRPQEGPLDIRNALNTSTIKQLALKIGEEKKAGQDARNDEVDFYKRFSIPFSALAFALIGIPLGLMARTGSFTGPFLAVILVVIYELFIMFGQTGGPMGLVSPFLAMWLPNFVLIVMGFVMVYWLNHKIELGEKLEKIFMKKQQPDIQPTSERFFLK